MDPRRLTVNCSILFTDLPRGKRPHAARDAGFQAVEFWWPFPSAVPTDAEVDQFIADIDDAGVRLTHLNLAAGDLAAGERGILSDPRHTAEFRDSVEIAHAIGERLGVVGFNALYGNRLDATDPAATPAEQDDVAASNLAFAARAMATIGADILLEPLSAISRYPLRRAADADAVAARIRREYDLQNVRLLADLYHLTINGDDLDEVLADPDHRIGHVQIADVPGRGEPGTGSMDLRRHLATLEHAGYSGWISLEYQPTRDDPFDWITQFVSPTTRPTATRPTPTRTGRQQMTTIAFIGLGVMGSPMSVNLVRAGHTVIGVNRTPSRAADLVRAGGTAASSIAEAVTDADVVMLNVPDSSDVEMVLTADDGVFAHVSPGTTIIDFSTISPAVAVRMAEIAREHDVEFLDAPVSGGEEGAVAGTLSIMVGGAASAFTAAAPILEAVGATVIHVGPSGSGQIVKAANQLIVAANIEAVAEAIAFLEAHDVDTAAATTVLAGGLAGSTVLDHKAHRMITRDFVPGGRIDLHHKDLGIVTGAARDAGVVLPLGSLMATLMASARANGDGSLDHSALFRGVLRLSGRLDDQ